MKKTAVEIAIFRIKQLQIGLSSSSQKIALEQVMDILEQAKEMEKEQIIDFAKKFSDFNGLTFNEQKVSKEYLEKFYTNKISKTNKCDWCNKRKIIDNGYYIGKLESSKSDKEYFICVDCNLKHDIV